MIAKFKCRICLEHVPDSTGVALGPCEDRFCTHCALDFLKFIVSERSTEAVPCPICRAPLNDEKCLELLATSKNHAKTYKGFARMVSLRSHTRLRYCSNTRCGVPFDWVDAPDALDACIQCPLCWALTCAECRAPWHEEWTCAEARRIRADAAAVGTLAKENRWMPCPNCHALIEKTDGCNHIHCICGQDFCYWCGVAYMPDGRGCDCHLLDDPQDDVPTDRLTHALTAANRTPAAVAGPPRAEPPLRVRASGGSVNGEVNLTEESLRSMSPPTVVNMLRRNKCPYRSCGRAFSNSKALQQHLASVRSHPVWICCGQLFPTLDAYCQHHRSTQKHFEYKEPKGRGSVGRPGNRFSRKQGVLQWKDDYEGDWDEDELYMDDYT